MAGKAGRERMDLPALPVMENQSQTQLVGEEP